jgi:hypothetical protein
MKGISGQINAPQRPKDELALLGSEWPQLEQNTSLLAYTRESKGAPCLSR